MRTLAIAVVLCLILGASILGWWVVDRLSGGKGNQVEYTEQEDGTLLFDVPGLTGVRWKSIDEIGVGMASSVIGFVVNGESRCLLVSAMEVSSLQDYAQTAVHIVNVVVGGTPVSITYCDELQCTRVLRGSDDAQAEPLPLSVGGWSPVKGLLLKYEGKRYEQTSKELPLQDFEFEMTTLGEWLGRHPNTLIFDGTLLDAADDR